MQKLKFYYLILLIVGSGAGLAHAKPPVSKHVPTIVSFENEFQAYLEASSGKQFPDQLAAWDKLIEKPHQDFFDSAVWEKQFRPNWNETKTSALKNRFAQYPIIKSRVIQAFAAFAETIQGQMIKVQKVIPGFKADFPIYAIVAPNFDAKSAVIGNDVKSVALTVALDSLVVEHANTDVLFPHELFHAFHAKHSGFLNDGVMPNVSILIPLWEEGLATYISSLLNEQASDADLLFDEGFRHLSKADSKWLAQKFIAEMRTLTLDPMPTDTFKKWFSSGKTKVRQDLPNRCGYFLGLQVVRAIRKNHSLREMLAWKPKQVERYIVPALNDLAK